MSKKFHPGSIIENYRLTDCCGEGAYGTVFLASNLTTGQKVALKVIEIPRTGNRWKREIAGLTNYCRIRHPNLLPVFHVGEFDECVYYTMEPADNLTPETGYTPDTLANRLQQGRLSPYGIKEMTCGLLDGLEELHRHGLVHRDIKPDNIIWSNGRPTLADIGLVTAGKDMSFAGTPGFFRPELFEHPDGRENQNGLYALGKVMYCALTGNAVTDYPSFPKDLSLKGTGELVRCYTQVCDRNSSISDVSGFRNLLLTVSAGRRRNYHPWWFLLWIFLLAGLLYAGVKWYFSTAPQAEPTQKQAALTTTKQQDDKSGQQPNMSLSEQMRKLGFILEPVDLDNKTGLYMLGGEPVSTRSRPVKPVSVNERVTPAIVKPIIPTKEEDEKLLAELTLTPDQEFAIRRQLAELEESRPKSPISLRKPLPEREAEIQAQTEARFRLQRMESSPAYWIVQLDQEIQELQLEFKTSTVSETRKDEIRRLLRGLLAARERHLKKL